MKYWLMAMCMVALPCAAQESPVAEYARVAAETPWTRKGDGEVRELHLQGPVVIVEQRDKDGRTFTGSFDNTAGGAPLCARDIIKALYLAAERCGSVPPLWRDELADALDRIDGFIAANTPAGDAFPSWQEEVGPERRVIAELLEKKSISPEVLCRGNPAKPMLDAWIQSGPQEFRAFVDRVVAIPRIPAFNPCL